MDIRKELEDAYSKNYRKWYQRLRGISGSHELAEDAIQEACKRSLMWNTSFDGSKPFDKWFNSILNNSLYALINEERRGGVKVEYKEEFAESHTPSHKLSFDIVNQVEEAIDKLDTPKKEVAKLYFLKGYTPRDICQIVDMSNNAVRQFIKRYRKILEDIYETDLRS